MTASGNRVPLYSFRARWVLSARLHPMDELLDPATLLEDRSSPRHFGWVLLGVSVLFLALFAGLDRAAVTDVLRAQGEVQASGPLQTVTGAEGGAVQEWLVADGQIVQAGAPILRLDVRVIASEREQLVKRGASLALNTERLAALLEDRLPAFEELAGGATEMAALQAAHYDAQRAVRAARRAVLESRMSIGMAELASHHRLRGQAQTRIAAVAHERERFSRLATAGLVPSLYLEEIDLRHAGETEVLALHDTEITRLAGSVEVMRGQLEGLDAAWQAEILAQYQKAEREADAVAQAVQLLSERLERSLVVAPAHGVVILDAAAIGGERIAAGTPVAHITPLQDDLRIAVEHLPQDPSGAAVGDRVTLNLTSADRLRDIRVEGRIVKIGPVSEGGNDARSVEVAVDDPNPYGSLQPRPGMLAILEVPRDRSLLAYLIQPLRVFVDRLSA